MAFETGACGPSDRVPPSPAAAPDAPERGWILLAEDDDELRCLMADALRGGGYAVEEAINGADLLAKVGRSLLGQGRHEIGVVVTDIQMPGFTGLEVLAALHSSAPSVPVIVVTAFSSAETRAEARTYGARDFLEKPLDMEELRRAVAAAMPASVPPKRRA
ncbi:MAG: response regulator [Deltaproteobacteria bacterium]|nr:response regulator [Deltaproteobacteria bacterium]